MYQLRRLDSTKERRWAANLSERSRNGQILPPEITQRVNAWVFDYAHAKSGRMKERIEHITTNVILLP
jgi:hypothetical protein